MMIVYYAGIVFCVILLVYGILYNFRNDVIVVGRTEKGDQNFAIKNFWKFCEMGSAIRPEVVRNTIFLVMADDEDDIIQGFNLIKHYEKKWCCFVVPDEKLLPTVSERYTWDIKNRVSCVSYVPGTTSRQGIIRMIKECMPIWLRIRRMI